ncbi:competence protein CoiA family protein [Streptomyces sp. TN58]|uniref:competence protein CoiA family protein n=1 Tax=Streptomyces sp. TN58 TaxID=234612 RepID=UPI000950A522|nr:competence protein CoiA family protein [Streptomyces sp. TN58]APU42709.1 hypothetical protein BSL84_25940 [Streptomyces sp. TN58]
MTPFADEEDTRKVQTAVLGRAGSDNPVFLPYDHDEFDLFMRGRSRDDFYCGTLLGGCGKKLSAKRYTEKKCHFAHRPPVQCRRTANGESSADHLYIGQALQDWLRGQGHRKVTVTYPDLGAGPGGAVEVRFESARRLIRVQMGRLPLRTWQGDLDRLARAHARGVHWAYGTDSGLAHNEVEEHGHAIRFSCRTERGTRQVYVGTQFPGHAVEWATLAECRLTDDGIVTPTLAEKPDPVPVPPAVLVFPLQAGSVAFTGAAEVPSVRTDHTRFYEADMQPEGSAATRARIGLSSQAPVPLPHLIHVLTGPAQLYPLEDAHWLIRADAATPLPHRTDPRWPDLHPSQPPAPAVAFAPDRGALDEQRTVRVFRRILGKAHRQGRFVTWEQLVGFVGARPADFTAADRVRLLVAVDAPLTSGKPLLSARVKSSGQVLGGHPAPFFADVLAGLGWDAELTPAVVHGIWRRATAPVQRAKSLHVVEERAWQEDEAWLVSRLREHLHLVANGRGLVKWNTLLQRQNIDPSSVSPVDRVRLLAAVDKPYEPGRPVYSSVVRANDRNDIPPPFFREVLDVLGWQRPEDVHTLEAAWRLERDRVYTAARRRTRRSGGAITGTEARPGARDREAGEDVVDAVRRVLVDAARRRVCVGWRALAEASGTQVEALPDAGKLALLIAVDKHPSVSGVLLSSLVVRPGDPVLPYFDEILRAHGRPHGLSPVQVGQVRKYEQARVFEAYNGTNPAAPKEDA